MTVTTEPVSLSIRDTHGVPRLYRLSPVVHEPGKRWAWRLYSAPDHDWIVSLTVRGDKPWWDCDCPQSQHRGVCKHATAVRQLLTALGFDRKRRVLRSDR